MVPSSTSTAVSATATSRAAWRVWNVPTTRGLEGFDRSTTDSPAGPSATNASAPSNSARWRHPAWETC